MILFLLLCIMVLSWYVSFRYKRRRLYELADALPNPKGLSRFLGMLQYSFKSTDVAYEVLKEYCKFAEEIGGLIKLWAGPILLIGITRPKDVEFILKKFPEKESRERLLRAFIGDAGIYAPVSIWARRRKILVPAFSPKIVSGFLDVIISQSEVMTEQLSRRNHIGTGSFEFWPFASAYTLDNIAQTSLGVNLKAQENPELPFLKAIYRTLYLMTKRMFSVWLWPDWLYSLTPTYREMVGCNAILHGFTDKIIQERRENLKGFNMEEYNSSIFGQGQTQTNSFLDHLILQSGENKISNIELREEILVFLIAGTDTSAVAICTTLLLMAKYPKVQERVYEELRSVLKDGRIDKSNLQELHYLQRVIKESLRLFPPAPLIGRKLDMEATLPSGAILPEGSEIIIPIWGIHRDINTWGPTAECFDPDRFLSEDQGLFIPFSAGPRNCIGYQYALYVVKIGLAQILLRYKVVGEEESGPVPSMDLKYSIMLRAKDDYRISLERRT